MSGVDLSQFYDMFFDEADELLADMEQLLLGLDIDDPSMDDLNGIFRAAHSIKGGAGTFGTFEHLAETTHVLENVLDSVRKGELALHKGMIDVFLEAKDVLTEQLAAYRNDGHPDEEAYGRICAQLRALALEQRPAVPEAPPVPDHSARTDTQAAPHEGASADPAAVQAVAAGSSAAVDDRDNLTQQAPDPSPETMDAEAPVPADGAQVLRIALSSLSESDARALEAEMAIMGTVLKREQPAPDTLVLWLDTTASSTDIEAVCCFVVNANQLDVQHDPSFGTPRAGDTQPDTHQTVGVQAGDAHHAAVPAQPLAGTEATAASQVTPDPQAGSASAAADAAPTADLPASNASGAPAQPETPATRAPAGASGASGRAKPAASSAASSSLRVGVEKVDQIINLVGELVITQAMLTQTVSGMDPVVHDRLMNGVEQLERNARDLQEAVMSIRMMPMDYVFSRFPRVVRESASAMQKKIRLVTQGQATELDKSLIERIIDPLTHLVRNSIDHGVELPEDRVRAGKDPEGVLTLSAEHSGGHIVIQVADDGAGLNRERILAKAISSGFPVDENTPDDELWQLIFAPGFSTAEKVTAISGRGVGMDVVRRNIQGMGGHIHLSSTAGKGTVTRIILPLTLAILDGMSVQVGQETFILPLSHVMESMQPEPDQIRQISDAENVLYVRGEYLPLIALHDLFDVQGAETDITRAIAVILKAEEQRFALLVDHLIGQHQVVVKNLEANYRKIPGISAATILGDGSVALIVDVFALMRLTQSKTV